LHCLGGGCHWHAEITHWIDEEDEAERAKDGCSGDGAGSLKQEARAMQEANNGV